MSISITKIGGQREGTKKKYSQKQESTEIAKALK